MCVAVAVMPFSKKMLARFREVIVTEPLRQLVLHGPRLQLNLGIAKLDLGFWQGLPLKDVCSQMSSFGSDHWARNEAHCTERVMASVTSIEVLIAFVVYVTVLVRCTRTIKYGTSYFLARLAEIAQPSKAPINTPVTAGASQRGNRSDVTCKGVDG